MWFILPLLIGAFVVVAVKRRESRQRELPPGPAMAFPVPPRPPGSLPGPGPINTLGEFLRAGQVPPPPVILCAIAEAEAMGRCDLSSDIVRVFVAPVVYQHQGRLPQMPARQQQPYARGSCQPTLSPRAEADACRAIKAPAQAQVPPQAPLVPGTPVKQPSRMPTTDEEIRAMLNVDPEGFIALMTGKMSVAPTVIDVPVAQPQQQSPQTQPIGLRPETVAQMQEAAGLSEAAERTRAANVPGSPLRNVADAAWLVFVKRLERESPQFDSTRHVGQYRQRRERLADLGIDPRAIHGSPQAQRAALDADLSNAYQHAAKSGLLSQLGRPIAVPEQEAPTQLTLSGLLGVIQCAGLEGAAGWLEQPDDRKRYPHTTQAFVHTNGVF